MSMETELYLSLTPGVASRLARHRLREDSDKPIVLLASGTGFAPIKALIEHMQFKGITRPTALYWGGRRPGDLYLHDWVLARAAELQPGLLLIDVDLGVRSGLTIAQELRLQRYPGALVVFSGAADTRTRKAAEKAGADAFLAKPLDLRRLLAWMRGLLPADGSG